MKELEFDVEVEKISENESIVLRVAIDYSKDGRRGYSLILNEEKLEERGGYSVRTVTIFESFYKRVFLNDVTRKSKKGLEEARKIAREYLEEQDYGYTEEVKREVIDRL